jgi:hypothetical protein
MILSQPFQERLSRARRVLLAGCGGGYDILGAVPLLVDLLSSGREVYLASLSFCYLNGLPGARQHREFPNLYEVGPEAATAAAYCPEAWLSAWIEQTLGRRQPIYCFDKTGVRPLADAYFHLISSLDIDCVVLVDGGVDSLLRGDEISLGTPSEDLTSLAAVSQIQGPERLLCCVGLGAEMRDGIRHAQVFERVAALTKQGGYLGAAALSAETEPGRRYLEAVDFVFQNQAAQRKSHVHTVITLALEGEFGSRGEFIWLSPLLPVCWFFSLATVAETHLLLPHLHETSTIWEVSSMIEALRKNLPARDSGGIPL